MHMRKVLMLIISVIVKIQLNLYERCFTCQVFIKVTFAPNLAKKISTNFYYLSLLFQLSIAYSENFKEIKAWEVLKFCLFLHVSPTSLILVTYYGDFISRVRVRVRFRYKVISIIFVIWYVKKRPKFWKEKIGILPIYFAWRQKLIVLTLCQVCTLYENSIT